MKHTFTLLDGGNRLAFETHDGDRVRIPEPVVREGLGWALEAEGLCREATCIPVRDRDALVSEDGLDLLVLADLLGRPLALDADEHCAALGTDRDSRAAEMTTLQAPDFELPDKDGNLHRLSDQRGKKVLLVAYASW